MKKIISLVCLLFLISGCATGNNASQDNNQDDRVKVQNSTAEQVNREESEEKSNHLAELAERVPEVKDATALVIGDFAVVGIDVKEDLERSEVGSIKYAVTESMKDDPHGANAMVVADPDLTARLKEVADDFRKGHPIQGIMNELADITGRIIPQIPADNLEPLPKDPKPTEEPDDKLTDKEEKKLEKTQNRQSNYQKEKRDD
jgi:YhcN/YlaJ family sporulation lipoprotein